MARGDGTKNDGSRRRGLDSVGRSSSDRHRRLDDAGCDGSDHLCGLDGSEREGTDNSVGGPPPNRLSGGAAGASSKVSTAKPGMAPRADCLRKTL